MNKKAYGKYENVRLTEDEFTNFREAYENAENVIEELSRFGFDRRKEFINDYATLLIFERGTRERHRKEQNMNREKLSERIYDLLIQEGLTVAETESVLLGVLGEISQTRICTDIGARKRLLYERYHREALVGFPPPDDAKDMMSEDEWRKLIELAKMNYSE